MDNTGEKRNHLDIKQFLLNLVNVFRLLERVASAQPFLHVVKNRSTEGDKFSDSGF